MKVLISLTDVEPAVRLNAQLEASGVETAVVSPLDDVRGAIRREQPSPSRLDLMECDPATKGLARRNFHDLGPFYENIFTYSGGI